MGFLKNISSIFQPKASTPGPFDDFWYGSSPYLYSSGVKINATTAMQVTSVYACVRLLSESAGSVPCQLFDRTDKNSKELAVNHPLYKVLLSTPNFYQTAFEFWEQVVRCCALRGFFYAEILTNFLGQVEGLLPLHPDRVSIERLVNGKYRYRYFDFNGVEKIYLPEELFRVLYLTEEDGMTPISPIQANSDSVGITEAAERYAASYFGNSATPSGSLEADGKLDPTARKAIRESWDRMFRGPDNAGKIAVLDQGLKFKQITINNQDSQLLETRQFQLTDICRIYRVPPHLVQDLQRSTFKNIEHQSLDFATHTMRPWFRRIEAAITRDLLLSEEKDRYFAKFNLLDLLAADAATRAQYNASGIQNGWMTPNEARLLEDMNPIEGLDEPMIPSNLRKLSDPLSENGLNGQQSTNKGP